MANEIDLLLFQIPNFEQAPYFVGMAALKSYLDAEGFKVEISEPLYSGYLELSEIQKQSYIRLNLDHEEFKDSEIRTIEKIVTSYAGEIEKFNPKMIGFSVIHGNTHVTFEVSKRLKEKFPHIKISVGGIGMRLPTLWIKSNSISWDRWSYDHIDFMVKGEGEIPLGDLLRECEKEIPQFQTIKGLIYKGADGYKTNHMLAPSFDLEKFPFPNFTPFLDHKYYFYYDDLFYPITFSRGCPYSCSFCSVPEYAMNYRYYSVSKCVTLMKNLYENEGADHFFCMDSICNGNLKWLKKFCLGIYMNNLPVTWGGSFRIQKQMRRKKYFDLLGLGRCTFMIFGLESGSPSVLKHMKKFHNREIIDQIFEVMREVQKERELKVHLQIIVGYPTETDEDFQMTLEFIRKFSDVITSLNTVCSFLLGETQHLVDEMKRDYELEMVDSTNWSTSVCTPMDRLRRMNELEKVCQDVNVPYTLFFKDRLETLLECGKAVV